MLVTINVKKKSSFAKYNGKTFEVNQSEFFTVKGKLIIPIKGINNEFPQNYTDFSQDEIIFL
jgi:hypothetical protein